MSSVPSVDSVPKRFSDEIVLHLVRNARTGIGPPPPLILGIAGPPGVGKSWQTSRVLENLEIGITALATSDLSSSYESEAAEYLTAKYVEASVRCENERKPYALICDDVDAAIGKIGDDTTYTVNRQHLSGTLMHFCDKPTKVTVRESLLDRDIKDFYLSRGKTIRAGEVFEADTVRVPIFFTGNDLVTLYAPLRRPGRMNIFHWIPNDSEKAFVISKILASDLNSVEISQLITACNTTAQALGVIDRLTVAFYANLKSIVSDQYILSQVEHKGLFQRRIDFKSLVNSLTDSPMSLRNYCDVVEKCVHSLVDRSHLGQKQ